jgi:hypothetical protein
MANRVLKNQIADDEVVSLQEYFRTLRNPKGFSGFGKAVCQTNGMIWHSVAMHVNAARALQDGLMRCYNPLAFGITW